MLSNEREEERTVLSSSLSAFLRVFTLTIVRFACYHSYRQENFLAR
jgi:hypothetical protein